MTTTKPLHEVLTARREEVFVRWKAAVQGSLLPDSLPQAELVDHLPAFLREVVAALRADLGLTSTALSPDESTTAAEHGEQRLRLGFSLDAVVREYGELRQAIVSTAADAGVIMSLRELQILFSAIVEGIAGAVSEYSRQRDAEMQRQHNEHFAFLAHELRNPLSSCMQALDLLKRKEQIAATTLAAGSLERGLVRMHELIDHSLQVALIGSGVEMRREAVALRALLEDAQSASASDADAKGIQVQLTMNEEIDVVVDVRLVRSALSNLVRNAVKYSCSDCVVELRSTVTNGRVTIEVEDACGGLPPGKVEQAFAPFVRLDNKQSGFGLGLAIAKQAVDAHGGAIRVQNLPGKGCIFVLELPCA